MIDTEEDCSPKSNARVDMGQRLPYNPCNATEECQINVHELLELKCKKYTDQITQLNSKLSELKSLKGSIRSQVTPEQNMRLVTIIQRAFDNNIY